MEEGGSYSLLPCAGTETEDAALTSFFLEGPEDAGTRSAADQMDSAHNGSHNSAADFHSQDTNGQNDTPSAQFEDSTEQSFGSGENQAEGTKEEMDEDDESKRAKEREGILKSIFGDDDDSSDMDAGKWSPRFAAPIINFFPLNQRAMLISKRETRKNWTES